MCRALSPSRPYIAVQHGAQQRDDTRNRVIAARAQVPIGGALRASVAGSARSQQRAEYSARLQRRRRRYARARHARGPACARRIHKVLQCTAVAARLESTSITGHWGGSRVSCEESDVCATDARPLDALTRRKGDVSLGS